MTPPEQSPKYRWDKDDTPKLRYEFPTGLHQLVVSSFPERATNRNIGSEIEGFHVEYDTINAVFEIDKIKLNDPDVRMNTLIFRAEFCNGDFRYGAMYKPKIQPFSTVEEFRARILDYLGITSEQFQEFFTNSDLPEEQRNAISALLLR